MSMFVENDVNNKKALRLQCSDEKNIRDISDKELLKSSFLIFIFLKKNLFCTILAKYQEALSQTPGLMKCCHIFGFSVLIQSSGLASVLLNSCRGCWFVRSPSDFSILIHQIILNQWTWIQLQTSESLLSDRQKALFVQVGKLFSSTYMKS